MVAIEPTPGAVTNTFNAKLNERYDCVYLGASMEPSMSGHSAAGTGRARDACLRRPAARLARSLACSQVVKRALADRSTAPQWRRGSGGMCAPRARSLRARRWREWRSARRRRPVGAGSAAQLPAGCMVTL